MYIKSKYSFICILFSLSVLCQSCAAILNSRNQPITINTGNQDAKVLINGDVTSEGETIRTKLRRDKVVKQIQINAPGYKNSHYCTMQYKRSFLCFFTGFPFVYLFFYDDGKKSYNYPKSIETPARIKLKKNSENLKYISLNQISFDRNCNFRKTEINYKSLIKYNADSIVPINKIYYSNLIPEEINNITDEQQTYFENLQMALKTVGFIDTVHYILKTYDNNLKLNLTVQNLTLITVNSVAEREFLFAQGELLWELQDVYGQVLKTIPLQAKSGQFSPSYFNNNNETVRRKILNDLFENSLYNLLNDPSLASILEKSATIETEALTNLSIKSPVSVIDSTGDPKSACVVIKTKDKIGSGFAINNDGYIITNYQLISSKDTLQQPEIFVITHNGETLKASIVRSCISQNLVLLKVSSQFEKCFKLPNAKNYKFGDNAFTFGTRGIKQYDQSLSIGTLASDRKVSNSHFIQISININKENEGAAIFSDNNRNLIGMVCSKLSGKEIEGIAFGIPAYKIKEYLNISFN